MFPTARLTAAAAAFIGLFSAEALFTFRKRPASRGGGDCRCVVSRGK
jgi:hypothetical protein